MGEEIDTSGDTQGAVSAASESLSPPSESAETSGTEAVRCSRCGTEAEPTGKGQCGKCGCWLPRNEGALVHGGRRLQLGRGSPLDEARRVELRDVVVDDLGGRDDVSAVLFELVEDFSSACTLRDVAWQHLAAVGPLTRAGRRRAVVDLYLQSSQRAERLAARIGMERKPARVPSLSEYLRDKGAADSD